MMGELEAIKYRHRRAADILGEVCWTCSNTEARVVWPCDTAVALAEVERLRGVVEAAREAHRRDLIARYSGFDYAWENHLEFAKAYCLLCCALEAGDK